MSKGELQTSIMRVRNAMNACEAYQMWWLKGVRKVPRQEAVLATMEALRKEAGKALIGEDVGTVIVREKIVAEAYIGLLDALRDGLVQAVQREEKG